MAILGAIIKRTFELRGRMPKIRRINGVKQQQKVLKKLLAKSEFTAFGEHYNFSKILNSTNIIDEFRNSVPTYDYNSIYKQWWKRALDGEKNVTWHGKIKYFALSSGTSEASSKYIPVTREMLNAIVKTTTRQLISQAKLDLPKEHFERRVLMIGGSTDLKYNGTYYEGDLSGITTSNVPFYAQNFGLPESDIKKQRDWETKLDEMVKRAKDWDVGIICGVPAWIQILFERIIAHYKVNNIHDIWPNLLVYIHGGVSIAPYKKGFEKLLGKPILFFDTYLASEGFIAFQDRADTASMRMMLDIGIFFEFVPFDEKNFDADGNMIQNPETLHIGEVEENKEYALLLSTCSGAWRYLLGDVIKFTSLKNYEIIIAGRTKHFLSLCGEHLSQDNMNSAIEVVSKELNIDVKEFTVAGIKYDTMFAHHWYIGTDDVVDAEIFKNKLDEKLKELNDDYKVERISALKDVILDILPSDVFYEYMKQKGKIGAQNKFPRVLKGDKLDEWQKYLNQKIKIS
jgi:hypothetical protein